ncbi:MAG: indole-3-glycerol phosphate synthase TrpC [Lachnospiraceae bacterium]|nr:indole-3-glycerol phosphate synthase TrpC [Lachnospiraceae bacterium]
MSILTDIAAVAKDRVAAAKKTISAEELKAAALSLPKGDFAFEKALKKPGLSFICECKKASPSKGIIAEDFPYLDIAKEYEAAGADAISCLTEPKWFLGRDEYLKEIAANVKIPVLRKDFTVDEYMIYEAKVFGASAVLLIMSILTDEQVKEYMSICDTLGLSALVECHDEEEIKRALDCGGRVIGVNNRNLKDFSVDMGLAARLRSLIPEDKVFVSESGIKDINDIAKVKEMGADAVLMGEVLMRSSNKAELLNSFK